MPNVPSRTENCPNILLEALAHGCAIACADVQPMREFAGEAALYFDPRDPHGAGLAMRSLLLDERLAAGLRARARERAQRYRWEEAAPDARRAEGGGGGASMSRVRTAQALLFVLGGIAVHEQDTFPLQKRLDEVPRDDALLLRTRNHRAEQRSLGQRDLAGEQLDELRGGVLSLFIDTMRAWARARLEETGDWYAPLSIS